MLQFDEYKVKLNNLAPTLEELGKALDLESAERELDMLQAESAADGFWNNLEKAQKVQQRIKNLQDKVDKQNKRRREWDDLMALCEMGNEIEAVIQEYSGWHSESAAGTAADSCRLFVAAYIQLEAPPWYLPVGTLSA